MQIRSETKTYFKKKEFERNLPTRIFDIPCLHQSLPVRPPKIFLKVVKKCKKHVKNCQNCQNVGQVMFPHPSDQMSQRSQDSRVTL